jgi:hypothetical protein
MVSKGVGGGGAVIVILILGLILISGAVSGALYLVSKDNDAQISGQNSSIGAVNTLRRVLDSDDTGNTESAVTQTGTREVILAGAVDTNNDGDFDDPGDIAPPKGATGTVELVGIEIPDQYNLLSPTNSLYGKIWILPPSRDFQVFVKLKAVGEDVDRVKVRLDLVQGVLSESNLRHLTTAEVRTMDQIIVPSTLKNGEVTTVVMKGVTPPLEPGKDWYIPKVIVSLDNTIVIEKIAWSVKSPTGNMWMTLSHPVRWTDYPSSVGWVSTYVSHPEGEGVRFVFDREAGTPAISSVTIDQFSYTGKYARIHEGPVSSVGFIQEVIERETYQWIGFSPDRFAFCEPNECYFRITAIDTRGNVIDFNKSPGDTAMRIHSPITIKGRGSWWRETEYFSSIGKIFAPFSIFGMGGTSGPIY